MLRITKLAIVSVALTVAVSYLGCTKDEEKVEEAVAPATPDAPGTPEEETPPPAAAEITAEPIYFAFDDYTLSAEAQAKLNQLAEQLKANPAVVVQIEGHCDERGSVEYNLALGQKRADAVMNYLIQLGVDRSRLSTISYGEERPAVEGHNEEAWAKNRRAEFVISQ